MVSVSVSVGEDRALGLELGAERAEVLDDAVVHDRDAAGLVRVGVALGRLAVGRPAGVADAGVAADRVLDQEVGERDQLADGAAAGELAVVHRGDAGAVVAAVLQPLQRLEDQRGDLVAAEDRDDAAHLSACPFRLERAQPLHDPLPEAGLASPAGRGRCASAAVGHVVGDDRARRDQRAGADADRRDERGVRADEGAGADLGAVLEDAVVVAGDGAGADVGAGADAGVADVAEVVGLGAFLDDGVLDLDEVADVRVLGDLGAGAQAGEGADPGAAADVAALEVAEGADRARRTRP